MSEIIQSSSLTLPMPRVPMTVRVGTRDDIAFMDRLQKLHSKALGFFPRAQMEGYIDGGNVLVAEDAATGERLGYVASKDRYLKRDELGAVFQLCVTPGRERGFIGANLLREVFERSSYGCRLYCCWCAQDLPANRFWEAMGFVPIAYRAGSAKKSRVHIYWQKRIRAGDVTTPYWFPAKTEGGAIREDRIILPIPPGMKWADELPILRIEGAASNETRRAKKIRPEMEGRLVEPTKRPRAGIRMRLPGEMPVPTVKPAEPATTQIVTSSPANSNTDRVKPKADPMLIAKARELRDRWMEQLNARPMIESTGKYDVVRLVEASPSPVESRPMKMLDAA